MNNVQMHLALTHVPVVLSMVGAIMQIVALVAKNKTLVKASYIILILAGISALPVYFSGEGAEEAVENIAGISENTIERHEDIAKAGMIAIGIAGIAALAGLLLMKYLAAHRILKVVVLAASLISGGFMFQTAKLGGAIRHTEVAGISSATAGQVNNETNIESNSEDDD